MSPSEAWACTVGEYFDLIKYKRMAQKAQEQTGTTGGTTDGAPKVSKAERDAMMAKMANRAGASDG